MTITGGCLCGAVRYTIDAEAPVASRLCWCRVCQYLAAGSASVNLIFPAESVHITGETSDYRSIADSGSVMHRGFCPACGTAITSAAETRPHLLIIRGGTLDDPELARPGGVIWTGSAPEWACIDPTLPAVEGQPAPPPPPVNA